MFAVTVHTAGMAVVQTTLLVTVAVGDPVAETDTVTDAIDGETKSGRRRAELVDAVRGGILMRTVTRENAAPLLGLPPTGADGSDCCEPPHALNSIAASRGQ